MREAGPDQDEADPVTQMPDLEHVIAVALAEEYTSPAREGVSPEQRLHQGMMLHFVAPDGGPSMAPVTPMQVAQVVMAVLQRRSGVTP